MFFISLFAMSYIDPENDPLYVQYWSQYPDLIDIESDNLTSNPPWLSHFEHHVTPIQVNIESIQKEYNDDDVEEEQDDYAPISIEYKSPPRNTWEQIEPMNSFDLQNLHDDVSSIVEQNIETLQSFRSQREQICFIIDLLRPNGNDNPLATFDQIGSIFHLSRGAIKSHYKRGIINKECGRKSLLSDEQINLIIDFVYEGFIDKCPVTYDMILLFLQYQFGISLFIKTLYKIVQRIPMLKTVNGVKMEEERVLCDPELIDLFYYELENVLTLGLPSALIINIDECGFSEWVDTNDIQVVVPIDYERDSIEIPVTRASKRSSMIAGIYADGSTLTPGIVVSRKTIEMKLYECWYTPEKVSICFQENGFFDTSTFLIWAYSHFSMILKQKGPCSIIMARLS